MSVSIGLSAASEKRREFPAFSTGRGNAFCLRHVGDARHVGDGGYSPCLFGYVTIWVGASQSDARQPIRTSVSETKEAVYRPMRGASWDVDWYHSNSARSKQSGREREPVKLGWGTDNRILKSLLPQNNTFFIATASVVKDAADDPDCQGLREQWYYLRFYVRRTMPPTAGHGFGHGSGEFR